MSHDSLQQSFQSFKSITGSEDTNAAAPVEVAAAAEASRDSEEEKSKNEKEEKKVAFSPLETNRIEDGKMLPALLDEEGVDEERLRWLASHGTEGVNNVFWRSGAGHRDLKREAVRSELGHAEFLVVSSPCGLHAGVEFRFKADTHEAMERWSETLCRLVTAHVARGGQLRKSDAFQRVRHSVHWYYAKDRSQMFVAALILSNFLVNIFEAQLAPTPETYRVFRLMDISFTALFTAELAVNLFATLVHQFASDPWNWFDLSVVIISLLSLSVDNLPGAEVMRLMRCFRVFRLFKRIPSFRNIIVSLTASVRPMMNAFSIVCLVTAIYAIVAVNFFRDAAPDNFAYFFLAFFSLFQVRGRVKLSMKKLSKRLLTL